MDFHAGPALTVLHEIHALEPSSRFATGRQQEQPEPEGGLSEPLGIDFHGGPVLAHDGQDPAIREDHVSFERRRGFPGRDGEPTLLRCQVRCRERLRGRLAGVPHADHPLGPGVSFLCGLVRTACFGEIFNQCVRINLAQTEVGDGNAVVLFEKGGGNGVFFRKNLVKGLNKA